MRFFIRSLFVAVALLVGILTTAVESEGLEILFALYGDLNANHADKKRVDVTQIVKAQVGSNEAYGFNERIKNVMFTAAGIDPAPGVVKGLLVVYGNAGKVYLHFSNYSEYTIVPSDTDYNLGTFGETNAVQIRAAIYGDLNKSGSTSKSDFARSKEIATTRLLQNNAMTIPPLATGEQKHQLFGDPAVGVNKGFLAVVSSWNTLFIGCYGQTETGTLSSTSYQFSATVGAATYAQARIKWTQTNWGAQTIAAGGNRYYSPNTSSGWAIDPSKGKVWSSGPSSGRYQVRDWNGSSWQAVTNSPMAMSIVVDEGGRPWIRNGLGIHFLSENGTWKKLPGAPTTDLHSVAVDNSSCWYISKSGMVCFFRTAFAETSDGTPGSVSADSVSAPPGGATSIYAAGGYVYVVGPNGLYRNSPRSPGTWDPVPTGNVKITAVAGAYLESSQFRSDFRLYYLGQDGKIYRQGNNEQMIEINSQPAVYPNENSPLPVVGIAVEDGRVQDGGLRIWAIDRSNAIYRSAPTFQ